MRQLVPDCQVGNAPSEYGGGGGFPHAFEAFELFDNEERNSSCNAVQDSEREDP